MSKMQNLQQALRQSTGKPSPAPEPVTINTLATAPIPAMPSKPESRAGQVNISAWLHPDFKSSLRLVQARKGRNAALQNLMAEALNDLFTKYDVPIIRQEKR
jgi:hypothetical protein